MSRWTMSVVRGMSDMHNDSITAYRPSRSRALDRVNMIIAEWMNHYQRSLDNYFGVDDSK
jgi:hypothetical protein